MKSLHLASSRNWLSLGGLRCLSSSTTIPSTATVSGQRFKLLYQQGNRATYSAQSSPQRIRQHSTISPFYRQPQPRGKDSRSQVLGSALHSTSATMAKEPIIHNVFESATGTWQYVVVDPATCASVIIDPVLDYDPATQAITTHSADALLALVKEQGYRVDRILETHAHADHLTASSYLQKQFAQIQGHKPPIGIGKRIEQVQKLFGQRYGLAKNEYLGVFDQLFEDDETFTVGEMTVTAIHLPGHTPDHLGYQIGDNIFCGDSLFHADIGTARCDFPGGDAHNLFQSGRKLLDRPDHIKIWPGHDYPPEGRTPIAWMSVGDHRTQNKHLRDSITEADFVAMRTERDKSLNAPRLLHPSLQVNIRAGRLPRPMESGHRMLHLPMKLNGIDW